jgi:hypothetical protein
MAVLPARPRATNAGCIRKGEKSRWSFQDRRVLAAELLLAQAVTVSRTVANGVDSAHHLAVVLFWCYE